MADYRHVDAVKAAIDDLLSKDADGIIAHLLPNNRKVAIAVRVVSSDPDLSLVNFTATNAYMTDGNSVGAVEELERSGETTSQSPAPEHQHDVDLTIAQGRSFQLDEPACTVLVGASVSGEFPSERPLATQEGACLLVLACWKIRRVLTDSALRQASVN